MPYVVVSMDEDLGRQVEDLFARNPGLWSSKRALWHDLVRRGLLAFATSGAAHVPASPVGPPEPHEAPRHKRPVNPPAVKEAAGEAPPPSPPSARAVPSSNVAPGPGEGRPSELGASPEAEGGRSPRPRPTKPAEADEERIPATPQPPTAPPAAPPVVDAPVLRSSWKCPRCDVVVPLEDREAHKATHDRPPAAERATPPGPWKVPDLDKLERHVVAVVGTGRLPDRLARGQEVAYLMAIARRGLEEQGIPEGPRQPADDVLQAWLQKLASKSSTIRSILGVNRP